MENTEQSPGNVAEYIDHIGRAELIERLGISTKTISQAKSVGRFPAYWYKSMLELAREMGRDAPPLELFAFRDRPAAGERPAP